MPFFRPEARFLGGLPERLHGDRVEQVPDARRDELFAHVLRLNVRVTGRPAHVGAHTGKRRFENAGQIGCLVCRTGDGAQQFYQRACLAQLVLGVASLADVSRHRG